MKLVATKELSLIKLRDYGYHIGFRVNGYLKNEYTAHTRLSLLS